MKILQSKITQTQTEFSINFGGKLSEFHPVFPSSSAPPLVRHIFSLPSCPTTIITLEPWALNAEFQHLILRFNKISLPFITLFIPVKWGESRPKDRVTSWITLISKKPMEQFNVVRLLTSATSVKWVCDTKRSPKSKQFRARVYCLFQFEMCVVSAFGHYA